MMLLVVPIMLGHGAVTAQRGSDASTMSDEQFVAYLESTPVEEAGVISAGDQRRLAKLFFSLAATLGGGKTNVRVLQGAMQVREPAAASVREMVAARYTDYAGAVDRFRVDVSSLLDRPESMPLLFRATMDGHLTCTRLDAYTRLMETYGVSVNDLLSILSSREACAQFRRAAFSRSVEGTIAASIEDSANRRARIAALEQEIAELEKLVEDLREIEER
jgi:hypothetical protein